MDRLEDHTVYTHAGSVTADNIIVAVDKLRATRSVRSPTRCFHAQTFLSVTEPLTDRELRILFPVRRADAVLGLEARVHVLPADRRQSPAARRRHGGHHLPEGRVQQSRASSGGSSTDFNEPLSRSCTICPSSSSGRARSMRRATCCRSSPGRRSSRTCASSSAAWAFRGRRSPAALRRATFSATPTRTTRSTSTTSPTSATSALPSSLGKVIGKPLLFSLTNSWAKFYQVDKLRVAGQVEKEF